MAYKKHTKESLIEACKTSKSYAQVLRALKLKPAGGNYDHLKKLISRNKIDISHFTHQGWNKDRQLRDWSEYKRPITLKPHLIKEKGHVCESCGLKEWLNEQITLEVHHKDGDRLNNTFDNLQLLCPNCHALTDNWRGKKNKAEVAKLASAVDLESTV